MDRFASILLWAGLGCFLLAFALSAAYPYLITDATVPEATLEQVAARVPPEFKELKAAFPVEFGRSFARAGEALLDRDLADADADDPRRAASEEAWRAAHAESLRRGRDVYVAEGCWHCHSQYVRPVANEDVRFGPVSTWQQDNNALQRPVLWGTRRVGPDLTYEGGLRSNDWHVAHFWDPTATTPGSIMPRFRWLFRQGWQVRRHIDPDRARAGGIDPGRSYPEPGVWDSREEAQAALERLRDELPATLADERERLFVAEGRGLRRDGLALLAYLQWLGTWRPAGEARP